MNIASRYILCFILIGSWKFADSSDIHSDHARDKLLELKKAAESLAEKCDNDDLEVIKDECKNLSDNVDEMLSRKGRGPCPKYSIKYMKSEYDILEQKDKNKIKESFEELLKAYDQAYSTGRPSQSQSSVPKPEIGMKLQSLAQKCSSELLKSFKLKCSVLNQSCSELIESGYVDVQELMTNYEAFEQEFNKLSDTEKDSLKEEFEQVKDVYEGFLCVAKIKYYSNAISEMEGEGLEPLKAKATELFESAGDLVMSSPKDFSSYSKVIEKFSELKSESEKLSESDKEKVRDKFDKVEQSFEEFKDNAVKNAPQVVFPELEESELEESESSEESDSIVDLDEEPLAVSHVSLPAQPTESIETEIQPIVTEPEDEPEQPKPERIGVEAIELPQPSVEEKSDPKPIVEVLSKSKSPPQPSDEEDIEVESIESDDSDEEMPDPRTIVDGLSKKIDGLNLPNIKALCSVLSRELAEFIDGKGSDFEKLLSEYTKVISELNKLSESQQNALKPEIESFRSLHESLSLVLKIKEYSMVLSKIEIKGLENIRSKAKQLHESVDKIIADRSHFKENATEVLSKFNELSVELEQLDPAQSALLKEEAKKIMAPKVSEQAKPTEPITTPSKPKSEESRKTSPHLRASYPEHSHTYEPQYRPRTIPAEPKVKPSKSHSYTKYEPRYEPRPKPTASQPTKPPKEPETKPRPKPEPKPDEPEPTEEKRKVDIKWLSFVSICVVLLLALVSYLVYKCLK